MLCACCPSRQVFFGLGSRSLGPPWSAQLFSPFLPLGQSTGYRSAMSETHRNTALGMAFFSSRGWCSHCLCQSAPPFWFEGSFAHEAFNANHRVQSSVLRVQNSALRAKARRVRFTQTNPRQKTLRFTGHALALAASAACASKGVLRAARPSAVSARTSGANAHRHQAE